MPGDRPAFRILPAFFLCLKLFAEVSVFLRELIVNSMELFLMAVLFLAGDLIRLVEEMDHLRQDLVPLGMAGIVHQNAFFVRIVLAQNARASAAMVLVLLQHIGDDGKEPVIDAEQVIIAVSPADPLPAATDVPAEPFQKALDLPVVPCPVIPFGTMRLQG